MPAQVHRLAVRRLPVCGRRACAGLSIAAKNELLFQHGINFNDLPSWHKRGVRLVWETYEKPAVNPKTGAAVIA